MSANIGLCGNRTHQLCTVKAIANADAVKQYKLEDYATVWESDNSISASIGEDDLAKKGKKLTVSVLVQTDDNSLQDAELVSGGFNTAEVEGFNKARLGITTIIWIIIAAVVVVVCTVVALIIIKKLSSSSGMRDKEKKRQEYQYASIEMEENKW
ncbi:MAG: hypothetical protein EZS28_004978 [Streblomastix strix]|uniref:Uncharacterized protein n=1 Tax=Streblomastix strix TaxID=222440 RepID=A0A5J4WZ68_9EUKA|nr:MAG: hypothetical protein EZS28_004978 [Streblomastix strix]